MISRCFAVFRALDSLWLTYKRVGSYRVGSRRSYSDRLGARATTIHVQSFRPWSVSEMRGWILSLDKTISLRRIGQGRRCPTLGWWRRSSQTRSSSSRAELRGCRRVRCVASQSSRRRARIRSPRLLTASVRRTTRAAGPLPFIFPWRLFLSAAKSGCWKAPSGVGHTPEVMASTYFLTTGDALPYDGRCPTVLED